MKTDQIPLRIVQTITAYYSQLKAQEITETQFSLWIESLQEPMRTSFKAKGLGYCRGVLNLQRFILELQDKGLEEYLKNELTEDEYKLYTSLK